jgi:hypothetical protein
MLSYAFIKLSIFLLTIINLAPFCNKTLQISLPIPEEAPVIKYFLSIKYVDLLISSINYFVTSFV